MIKSFSEFVKSLNENLLWNEKQIINDFLKKFNAQDVCNQIFLVVFNKDNLDLECTVGDFHSGTENDENVFGRIHVPKHLGDDVIKYLEDSGFEVEIETNNPGQFITYMVIKICNYF